MWYYCRNHEQETGARRTRSYDSLSDVVMLVEEHAVKFTVRAHIRFNAREQMRKANTKVNKYVLSTTRHARHSDRFPHCLHPFDGMFSGNSHTLHHTCPGTVQPNTKLIYQRTCSSTTILDWRNSIPISALILVDALRSNRRHWEIPRNLLVCCESVVSLISIY